MQTITTSDLSKEYYSTKYYSLHLCSDPYVHQGEPMNWLVVNKEFGTVEATTGVYSNGIGIANELTRRIEDIFLENAQQEALAKKAQYTAATESH